MSQSKHVQFAATALALAMSAAASAQTANVELAGQLGISITHKNNQTGGGSLNDVGDNTLAGSWFRISGSENLGGGMRVLFRLESSVALDTGNSGAPAAGKFFNRQAWIG
ncbi:MAG TPA: porin, partial [Casimicrobium sp.]|nr:porin [Casimicrobium sp.]